MAFDRPSGCKDSKPMRIPAQIPASDEQSPKKVSQAVGEKQLEFWGIWSGFKVALAMFFFQTCLEEFRLTLAFFFILGCFPLA